MKEQIAFFWRGENTQIPTLLVSSIRNYHDEKMAIIQISDDKTDNIEGVNDVIKLELPQEMMTARLKAYSQIKTHSSKTFFIDADSLMINRLDFNEFGKGIYLTKRSKDFIINHNFPEYYPEFEGKLIKDIMPFLFGAITIINSENIFNNLLEICMKLEKRFQRWYGDQVSLYSFYENNKNYFSFLEQTKYLDIIDEDEIISREYVKKKKDEDKIFVTFKGPQDVKRIFKFQVYSEIINNASII